MNEDAGDWIIDLERLLMPITAEQPAGESLRYEGTYDRVTEARREDDATLPQGIWQANLKRADWETVAELSQDALETRSKDLQLAAWLLEAWIHQHGFRGASQGLQLLVGLCEAFWEDLYPELDDEGTERRLGPLVWVNEKLSLALKLVPVTRPESAEEEPRHWADWEAAAGPGAGGEGLTMAQMRRDIMLTPKPFYTSLYGNLSDTLNAIVELERLLEEKAGAGPYLFEFRGIVQDIQQWVSSILVEREEDRSLSDQDGEDQGDDLNLPEGTEKGRFGRGLIRGRTEAYQQLSEIADYLSTIEPHSPTPYLIRRAVSWGGMTMTELFEDLVQNESDLRAIYALLGINR